ncbi:hypothetical protein [Neobacillus drentensis]|uniref:hypothetical protein n=1 Tax=Neobacillus drentensis TaxID=220684 RepID=UPI0030005219
MVTKKGFGGIIGEVGGIHHWSRGNIPENGGILPKFGGNIVANGEIAVPSGEPLL